MRLARLALAAALLVFCGVPARAAITFTPGDYYSSNYFARDIIQYDSAGTVVGSISLPSSVADEIKGIAFGPDGLLYATVTRASGFAVLALNAAGAVQQTYPMAGVYVAGNLSYGKLDVDGRNIFVAGGNQLTRFNVGDPNSGVSVYTNNQLFDVKMLPSGNLVVGTAYEVNEITRDGALVRNIEPVASFLTDVRGVEYDPATNKLFVTHLGHSGFFDRLMRIDFVTGALEKDVEFNYADDLFLTTSGNLLVGSRTGAPRLYTRDLDQVGTLAGAERMFVTQHAIPEPASAGLVAAAGLVVAAAMRGPRRRR